MHIEIESIYRCKYLIEKVENIVAGSIFNFDPLVDWSMGLLEDIPVLLKCAIQYAAWNLDDSSLYSVPVSDNTIQIVIPLRMAQEGS